MAKSKFINRVLISSVKNFRFGVYCFNNHRLICTDDNMAAAAAKVPWDICEIRTTDNIKINPPPKPIVKPTKSKGNTKEDHGDISETKTTDT